MAGSATAAEGKNQKCDETPRLGAQVSSYLDWEGLCAERELEDDLEAVEFFISKTLPVSQLPFQRTMSIVIRILVLQSAAAASPGSHCVPFAIIEQDPNLQEAYGWASLCPELLG